jgi:CheY-like chemotaxis protein
MAGHDRKHQFALVTNTGRRASFAGIVEPPHLVLVQGGKRTPAEKAASSPVRPPHPADPAGESRSSPLPRQLRVLVVDDDRDSVLTLMTLLRQEGHDVRAAYSGGSAIVVASHFKPDAIFIDIGLPDISGWEVARQVGQENAGRAPLLIAISGVYKKGADRILAQSVGFAHYVTKPYDPVNLLALLEPLRSPED